VARYSTQVKSAAALAVDTGFGWLMANAANGYKLRRVTIGVSAAGTPTSQQVTVGINRVTSAGTTPTAGATPGKLDPNSAAAGAVFNTAYATAPTATAADQFRVSFNSQSGVDLPWEGLEEFGVALGTANGLAFINRDGALPAGHSLTLSVEFEE
jgi:ABC-type branched-subunit amino acid transport system substrate-binding protein